MTSNQQNPFLTDHVCMACDQARVLYLDTLARKQTHGGTSIGRLQAEQAKNVANLDMYRDEAWRAAYAGDVYSASTQLASIVKEWGLFRAHADLIENYGMYLDPADPDTVGDFVQAVQQSVVLWTTELLNMWHEGETKRKTDLGNLLMQRQTELFGGYQGVIQIQGSALNQAHQHNKMYAETAFRGVQQAQQGAQWMMQGVERLNQQNQQWMMEGVQAMYSRGEQVMRGAAEMQRALTEGMVQNLPREMEAAQDARESRKKVRKGIIAVSLLLAVPVAIVLAWAVLQLVVLR